MSCTVSCCEDDLIVMFSEKIKISPYITLTIGAAVFVFAYPFVNQVNWSNVLPAPLAAYMYNKAGSLFPLFP